MACYLHIYMWLGLLRHNGGCCFEGVAVPSFHGVWKGDSRVGSNIGKGIGDGGEAWIYTLALVMVGGWEGKGKVLMLQGVIVPS